MTSWEIVAQYAFQLSEGWAPNHYIFNNRWNVIGMLVPKTPKNREKRHTNYTLQEFELWYLNASKHFGNVEEPFIQQSGAVPRLRVCRSSNLQSTYRLKELGVEFTQGRRGTSSLRANKTSDMVCGLLRGLRHPDLPHNVSKQRLRFLKKFLHTQNDTTR